MEKIINKPNKTNDDEWNEYFMTNTAQLLSYLKASGHKLGMLVNFSKSKVEYRRVVMG